MSGVFSKFEFPASPSAVSDGIHLRKPRMTQASSGKGNREEVPVVTGRAVRAAGFTAGEVNGVFPGEPIAELLAGLFYLRYVLHRSPFARKVARGRENRDYMATDD